MHTHTCSEEHFVKPSNMMGTSEHLHISQQSCFPKQYIRGFQIHINVEKFSKNEAGKLTKVEILFTFIWWNSH